MSPKLPALYRFLPVVTFVAVTVVNFWPRDDGRFDDDPETLVAAAGYAFSIWGVIFLGLIGFSVVLAKAHEHDTPGLRKAIIGLVVAGLASIAFVPISAGDHQLLGFLDIFLHLVALIYAYGGLREHVRTTPPRPRKQGFWYYGPSMYLGWISAATVISASLALTELGWTPTGTSAVALAIALIFVLFGIGRQFLAHADAVFALTVAWALLGVGVEQEGELLVRYTAWAGSALLIVSSLRRIAKGGYGFYASPGYYEGRTAGESLPDSSRITRSSLPS